MRCVPDSMKYLLNYICLFTNTTTGKDFCQDFRTYNEAYLNAQQMSKAGWKVSIIDVTKGTTVYTA